MFGSSYFGVEYFGASYFDSAGAGAPTPSDGGFFGPSYWGASYFGESHWGTFTPPTPSPKLAVSPQRLRKSSRTIVTFVGSYTEWLTNPPVLSDSGVDGVVLESHAVVTDVMTTAWVVTGDSTGTIVWTDATYGIQTHQRVGGGAPIVMLRPGPSRTGGRRG